MSTPTAKPATPSDRLLEVLADYERVFVITHDNPDPDAIAAGWAILCLVEKRLRKPVRLVGGGAIVRAENKHMVELLSPPIELVNDLDVGENTATILVDCGIGTTNHLAPQSDVQPVGVVDHHLSGSADSEIPFKDIRTDAVASASIAASYLHEQQVEPGTRVATAILYAIRTETCSSETDYSPLDRCVVKWLTDLADPTLLAQIENAPLDRDSFGDLVLAMQQTFLYDDAAMCFLPRATGAEIVGEVADLLVRCRGVRRVLCAAVINNDLLVSARTVRGSGNAATLLKVTLNGLGGCGGHTHRAGGKVPNVGRGRKTVDGLHEVLRSRWLNACAVDRRRGTRLVARREIVENL